MASDLPDAGAWQIIEEAGRLEISRIETSQPLGVASHSEHYPSEDAEAGRDFGCTQFATEDDRVVDLVYVTRNAITAG